MSFLYDTVQLMGWVGVALVPVTWLGCSLSAAIGVACGMLWAVGNFGLTGVLVSATFGQRHPSHLVRAGLWFLKVPLWYGVGSLLLLSSWSSPVGFLVGFSLWFPLLVISALRRSRAS